MRPDWICEFCFTPIHGRLPDDWDWVLQSAVCPSCIKRVARDGGYAVVKGGAYAAVPDPRPWPAEHPCPKCGTLTQQPARG